MDDPSLIGRELRAYTVVERLGSGGFGSVYRVHHRDLDVDRALKILHRSIAEDATQRERFLREARTTAHLRDRHIVPVLDVFEEDGMLCIVMELISPARTLAEEIREQGGPLEPDEAGRIAVQVGDALDSAHAQGVVHRDVKPQNILLREGRSAGEAMLSDFGISRTARDDGMTETGFSLGTPTYMSPEQLGWAGGHVDGRSDDYSFAIVLYEMVTARPPFGTGTAAIAGHLGEVPPPPASTLNRSLSPAVDAVLTRGLARDPGERFPLARGLADAFDEAVHAHSSRSRLPPPPPPPSFPPPPPSNPSAGWGTAGGARPVGGSFGVSRPVVSTRSPSRGVPTPGRSPSPSAGAAGAPGRPPKQHWGVVIAAIVFAIIVVGIVLFIASTIIASNH